MRKQRFLWFVTIIGAVGGYFGFVWLEALATSTSEISHHIGGPESFCSAPGESITLSPDGRYALLQEGERQATSVIYEGSGLSIIDLNCAAEQIDTRACVSNLFSPRGLRIMGWSNTGEYVYLVEGRRRLLRYGAKDKFEKPLDQAFLSRLVAARMISVVPLEGNPAETVAAHLETIAEQAVLGEPTTVAGIYAAGTVEASSWISEDKDDLTLGVHMNNGTWRSRLLFREMPGVRVSQDYSGDTFVSSYGAKLPLTQGSILDSDNRSSVPFGKPLYGSLDGRLLGFFNSDGIRLDKDFLSPELSKLIGGGHLQAVAVAESSQVVKSRPPSGRGTLSMYRNGLVRQYECIPGVLKTEFKSNLNRSYVSLKTHESGLYGILHEQGASKGTVVFFSGGPLNSADDLRYSVRQYLKMGWNVLAVNYSGSVGNGPEVASRVRELGLLAATGGDALAVANFLTANASEQIVIHGESFGALGAIALSAHMDKIGRPTRLVLVAPFLRHQDPDNWLVQDKEQRLVQGKIDPKFQRRFEKAIFNGSFDEDQRQLVTSISGSTPVLAIFANDDRMSTPEHVPDSWFRQSLTVRSVPGGHFFVAAMPQTWEAVVEWLP